MEIEIDGQAITIYNIHPHVPMYSSGFHGKGQKMAIDEIMVMVESEVNPVIIGGDMNMTDQFSAYRHITADLHDAYREVGWGLGFTFPNLSGTSFSIFPRILRLDYVFYDNTFQATEARVWSSSGGSDHRPLLVTLAIVSDE